MSLSNPTSAEALGPYIGRSVSIDHAALLLGVSRRTVYNRIAEGQLQTVRTFGGSQRVLVDSIVALGGRLPDARVVICRRDLLETCLACYRYIFAKHPYTHDFASLAAHWRDCCRRSRQRCC